MSEPLEAARNAAVGRAQLRTKAGWLRLRMGDAEGAAARLGEAQAELLRSVGPEQGLEQGRGLACRLSALMHGVTSVAFGELRDAMHAVDDAPEEAQRAAGAREGGEAG